MTELKPCPLCEHHTCYERHDNEIFVWSGEK